MSFKHTGMAFVATLALAAFCTTAQAKGHPSTPRQAKNKTVWIHPVIPRFGGVHPRPDADVIPDPKQDYKVFVDVVTISHDPTKMNHALGRLARLVNLMGYAKVPADHVHIVALLDRRSGIDALTDAAYARFMQSDKSRQAGKVMKNPNLPVLHALKKAGVKLMICSQAMAGLGVKDSEVDPSVTITLSGLTDPVVYGQRGYSFVQL